MTIASEMILSALSGRHISAEDCSVLNRAVGIGPVFMAYGYYIVGPMPAAVRRTVRTGLLVFLYMRVGRTNADNALEPSEVVLIGLCWSRRFRLRGCWWVNNLPS